MSEEKVQCKAEDCENMILPMTAARTGGICMRCENKRLWKEHEEYVRKNRREVDPYAGLSDPVEIIRTYHKPRKRNELIVYLPPPRAVHELYRTLTPAQCERLAKVAIQSRKTSDEDIDDLADDVARSLACFTAYDLSGLAMAWIKGGHLWPSVIFRGANAAVRDALIKAVDTWRPAKPELLSLNHALLALGWVGDEAVRQRFEEWESRPAAWQGHASANFKSYAHTAGWESVAGVRKNLFHETCLAISLSPAPRQEKLCITALDAVADACPWCGRALVSLLNLDTADPRLSFIAWSDPVLQVLTCDMCTAYAPHLFARVDSQGVSRWHPANQKPAYLPDDVSSREACPWRGVSIELNPRPPMEAVEWVLEVNASQIGGHPCWIQDADYPQCPDCQQSMIFIAQLDNATFPGWEGIHYAFLCATCRVTATAYQQT